MQVYDGLEVITDQDKLQKQEFKYLDTIDLEWYLKHSDWSILKIMDEIQEDHGKNYDKESYIFNAIEQDDFMYYIRKRYKNKYTFYVYSEVRVVAGK